MADTQQAGTIQRSCLHRMRSSLAEDPSCIQVCQTPKKKSWHPHWPGAGNQQHSLPWRQDFKSSPMHEEKSTHHLHLSGPLPLKDGNPSLLSDTLVCLQKRQYHGIVQCSLGLLPVAGCTLAKISSGETNKHRATHWGKQTSRRLWHSAGTMHFPIQSYSLGTSQLPSESLTLCRRAAQDPPRPSTPLQKDSSSHSRAFRRAGLSD